MYNFIDALSWITVGWYGAGFLWAWYKNVRAGAVLHNMDRRATLALVLAVVWLNFGGA